MKVDLRSLLILIAVVLVAAVGSAYVTSWVFTSRSAVPAGPFVPGGEPLTAGEPYDPALVWSAGSFTVNLAAGPSGISSYMKTTISFLVNGKRAVEELESRRVQVRDRVITVLLTTSARELAAPEGISGLKQRIMESINELIIDEGGRVHAVYLTELVIQ